MMGGSFADKAQDAQTPSDIPQVTSLPLHQLAQLIRSLDSQLLNITGQRCGEILVLSYTFAVAGKVQSFCTSVTTTPLLSIADLYPAALGFEAALQQQWGVVFHPYRAGLAEER